jgi:hypothetical protein
LKINSKKTINFQKYLEKRLTPQEIQSIEEEALLEINFLPSQTEKSSFEDKKRSQ